jgi:hypothetical protein
MNRQINLFIYSWFILRVLNCSDYTASNDMMTNEYFIGKDVEGSVLATLLTKLLFWQCLPIIMENTKIFNQDSRCMGQDLKTGPSEYKQQH